MIYLTSDLHFNHDRGFIYEPRGFSCIEDMNKAIIELWNSVVKATDDVYLLGDVMLGDYAAGAECVKQLNGRIHVVIGNHDTDNRVELYKTFPNVVEVAQAIKIKYNGYHFFMTHYPCFSGNLHHDSLKKTTCNLFGHTHSKELFYQDIPFMYNVAVDAHNCAPVSLDKIIEEMEEKVEECKEFL